jgi:hypothetical protein
MINREMFMGTAISLRAPFNSVFISPLSLSHFYDDSRVAFCFHSSLPNTIKSNLNSSSLSRGISLVSFQALVNERDTQLYELITFY